MMMAMIGCSHPLVWGFTLLISCLLAPATRSDEDSHHEYCVIGAGPAGLQMGFFLQRTGRDYVIFEKADQVGAFFVKYPRHRKLISINKRFTGSRNKEFNLRHDWNSLLSDDESLLVKHYSHDFFPHADDYLHYLNDYASKLQLNIIFNTEVQNISRNLTSSGEQQFVIRDANNGRTYRCHYLVVATGQGVPKRPPQFPGSEHLEYYDSMSLNQSEYEGQTVLILGRGNSGFETADHIGGHTALIHMTARSRVRLSWATHYVGDLRAINNQLLDTYQLKSLDALLEMPVEILQMVKTDGKIYVTSPIAGIPSEDETEGSSNDSLNQPMITVPMYNIDIAERLDNFALRRPYDRVIACLGFEFDWSIFDNETKPWKREGETDKYAAIKPNYESMRIPNMFFAGTNTHSRDFRKSSGGFIHGYRYTVRALHRLLEWRNHGVKWPVVKLPPTGLMDYMVKRMNEMSVSEVLGNYFSHSASHSLRRTRELSVLLSLICAFHVFVFVLTLFHCLVYLLFTCCNMRLGYRCRTQQSLLANYSCDCINCLIFLT